MSTCPIFMYGRALLKRSATAHDVFYESFDAKAARLRARIAPEVIAEYFCLTAFLSSREGKGCMRSVTPITPSAPAGGIGWL